MRDPQCVEGMRPSGPVGTGRPTDHGAPEPVRSAQRVLHLLMVLNRRSTWIFSELVQASGLAKTTVFRLLQTLEAEGFVRSVAGRHGLYRLTAKVGVLSNGITAETHFTDTAEPLIRSATLAIGWPVSFAIPEGCFLRVISCGMPALPERSVKPTSVGEKYWMFDTAVGKAYLSGCSEELLSRLWLRGLAVCASSGSELHMPSYDELLWNAGASAKRGYAVRRAGRGDANAAMAVPVRVGRDLIGSLACSTFPRSLSDAFIADVHPALLRFSAELAEACIDSWLAGLRSLGSG